MTIGTKIIKRALQKIGGHSILAPASPENIILGMENLNSMLQQWLDLDIQLEFTPLKEPGDELSEPTSARNAIISNLALYLGPDFDNGKVVISDNLRVQAQTDYHLIQTLYQIIDIPNLRVSGTTPKGSGNRRVSDDRVFFRPGEELGKSTGSNSN